MQGDGDIFCSLQGFTESGCYIGGINVGRRNWNAYFMVIIFTYFIYRSGILSNYFPIFDTVNVRPIEIPWKIVVFILVLGGLSALALILGWLASKRTTKKWEEEDIPRWKHLMEQQKTLKEKQEEIF